MAATRGYQAAFETNQVRLSYGVETAWGIAPAAPFQAIRFTNDTLTSTKTRARPAEINPAREASQMVTTKQDAAGDIAFALSWQTYDDLISVALGNDWGPITVIGGMAGDITVTGGVNVISSTTAGKFVGITVGQYLRLLGFTNTANNGIVRVAVVTDSMHLTVVPLGSAVLVTETPAGTAAQVRASTLQNGTQFKSLYLQKQLSPSVWMRYPGAFASTFTLSGGVGQTLTGKFAFVAQQEVSGTTDASTGGITPAPSGHVNDSIGAFGGVFVDDAAIAAVVDTFALTIANTGAAPTFGVGSGAAQGMLQGTLDVTGTMKVYFKDLTYYALFIAESTHRIAFVTKDTAGNAYVITLLAAALMNPHAPAAGPGHAVYATFTLEGNPQAGGGTIQIDRFSAYVALLILTDTSGNSLADVSGNILVAA